MFGKIKENACAYLRGSEKYAKTDMAYLAKSAFWTTTGQTGNALITFFLSIIFANFISKESYGVYAYILSMVGIFELAALPGIETSLARSTSAGHEGSLRIAFKEKFKWNILTAAISLGAAVYYYFGEERNLLLASSFMMAAFFLPIFESANLYDNFLTGKKLFKQKTLYFLATRFGFLASIFITLQFTRNIFYVLLVYFVNYSLFGILFYSATLKFHRTNEKKDPGLMEYAKHLSLMNILSQIAGQIDKIIVFHFLQGAAVAVYSFALAPVQQIKSLIGPLDTIIFPKFVKRDLTEIKKGVFRKMFLLIILTAAIVIVYVIIAPYFYDIFFPQYKDSIFYSRIYSIALLFSAIIIPKTALEAHAKIKSLYITKIVQPVVKITLLLAFTIYYGIPGTIIALLISQFFNLLFTTLLFRKESA